MLKANNGKGHFLKVILKSALFSIYFIKLWNLFLQDRFSTYALVYEDVKTTTPDVDNSDTTTFDSEISNSENKVPYTGDNRVLVYGVFMAMGLAAI